MPNDRGGFEAVMALLGLAGVAVAGYVLYQRGKLMPTPPPGPGPGTGTGMPPEQPIIALTDPRLDISKV